MIEVIQRGDYLADLAPGAVVRTEQDLVDAAVASLIGDEGRERGREALRKAIEVVSLAHLIVRVGCATFALVPSTEP